MLMTMPYTLSNWRIKLCICPFGGAFSEIDLCDFLKELCVQSQQDFMMCSKVNNPRLLISLGNFSSKVHSSRWLRECTVLWIWHPPEAPAVLCKSAVLSPWSSVNLLSDSPWVLFIGGLTDASQEIGPAPYHFLRSV